MDQPVTCVYKRINLVKRREEIIDTCSPSVLFQMTNIRYIKIDTKSPAVEFSLLDLFRHQRNHCVNMDVLKWRIHYGGLIPLYRKRSAEMRHRLSSGCSIDEIVNV